MSESTFSQRYASADSNTAGAFAFDTISDKDYAVSKLAFGAVGSVTYVSSADPLPVTISGVATAANQTTANGLLTTIDADTGNIATSAASIDTKTPALGQALAAGSVPVVLPAAQISTLTPPAAITGFALESGGNLAAAATDLAAIEVLLTTIEGNQLADGHNVTIANASIAVTGTFWQATQPVSAASLPLPTGASTLAEQQSQTTSLGRIAGKYLDFDTGAGTDSVVSVGLLLPASGGAVVGGTASNPFRVDVTGSTTQPVSGTVTAELGAVDNAVLDSIATNTTGLALEAGGNLAAIAGSLNVIDDWDESDRAKVNLIAGQAGVQGGSGAVSANTQRVVLATDVALPTGSNVIGGVSQNGTWTVQPGNTANTTAWLVTGTGGTFPVTGTFWQATQPVSLASVPSHPVTNAGTFVVQIDGNALTRLTDIETNTDSGAVVGNGAAATAQRVTLANDSTGVLATVTTVTTLTGGGIAHDSADSGNPHKIGAKASTSLSGLTLVANADRTDLFAGVDGVQITRNHTNLEDIVVGNASNTDGTSTEVIAAAGSGIKQYLTSVTLTNMSATGIYVEMKSGTTVRWRFPVPANSGVTHRFDPPLPPNAANEAWNFDPSAAATTIYCSAMGFKSKV